MSDPAENMVERARLAFVAKLQETPSWDRAKACEVADFRLAMRAAIEAMREPTEAMDVAGRFRCHRVDVNDGSMRRSCGGFLGETAAGQWQRMIDEALK